MFNSLRNHRFIIFLIIIKSHKNLHEKCGQGVSGRLGKAGRKVLLFIIKKPQFYDFFFFVKPEADKNAGLKLLGERRQAV
jgi:hypothetical protein